LRLCMQALGQQKSQRAEKQKKSENFHRVCFGHITH
jgi:hypothetical protein